LGARGEYCFEPVQRGNSADLKMVIQVLVSLEIKNE